MTEGRITGAPLPEGGQGAGSPAHRAWAQEGPGSGHVAHLATPGARAWEANRHSHIGSQVRPLSWATSPRPPHPPGPPAACPEEEGPSQDTWKAPVPQGEEPHGSALFWPSLCMEGHGPPGPSSSRSESHCQVEVKTCLGQLQAPGQGEGPGSGGLRPPASPREPSLQGSTAFLGLALPAARCGSTTWGEGPQGAKVQVTRFSPQLPKGITVPQKLA